ncbi:hypothetical protein CC79DRAFT_1328914 [Sarocladium strictum]
MTTSVKSPSLRKSCHNCTTAKRRCIIRFPHCERCSKKGLVCRYDLEPLVLTTISSQTLELRPVNGLDDSTIHCLLNKQSSASHKQMSTTCSFGSDVREGIEFVRATLRGIPSRTVEERPSVFIHPKLRQATGESCLARAIQCIRTTIDIHPHHACFQALINGRNRNESVDTVLHEVQALMLYILAFTFTSTHAARAAALPYFDHISQRVNCLQGLASEFTVRGLTPWQAWLFGESTRRTILTSHIMTCVFFRGLYETPKAKLEMEALPFDDRGGLWLAETPQAWAAAAGVRRGRDVKANLVSWHEFGCKSPSICMDEDGDAFLSMMLVAHNGLRCLQPANPAYEQP